MRSKSVITRGLLQALEVTGMVFRRFQEEEAGDALSVGFFDPSALRINFQAPNIGGNLMPSADEITSAFRVFDFQILCLVSAAAARLCVNDTNARANNKIPQKKLQSSTSSFLLCTKYSLRTRTSTLIYLTSRICFIASPTFQIIIHTFITRILQVQ